MSSKHLIALTAVLSLGACAVPMHTEEKVVTETITPGPGSATPPTTIVTDTMTRTVGPKDRPQSVATIVTTTKTTPAGTTRDTKTNVSGPVISPASMPEPVLEQDTVRATLAR
jgi:hypothetical protein